MAWSFVLNVIEDKMVNNYLWIFSKKRLLDIEYQKRDAIRKVLKFIIRNYSNRSWVRIFRQPYEPGYMTFICCTPTHITTMKQSMHEAPKCQAYKLRHVRMN
jgi:hypothetical protein